tara:strand:- start:1095 stop:2288 length:1194 start_codon:yes stop_codon:yes gene_type:complete
MIETYFNKALVASLMMFGLSVSAAAQQGKTYITTETNTVLISVNDGEAGSLVARSGQAVADSVTVINLSPTAAPIIKTVYGEASSTLMGSPHTTIIKHFAIINNHTMRVDENLNFVEAKSQIAGSNQVVIMDLRTLAVTDSLQLEAKPWLTRGHVDQERVVVGLSDGWIVLRVNNQGRIVEQTRSTFDVSITSFDLSSDGSTIIASVQGESGNQWLAKFILQDDSNIALDGKTNAQEFLVDAPFSPRIAPNGETALVLNSGGLSDGVLDDVLVIDLIKNTVIERVAQVSDGLESIAIHPSGEFAVIACLNAMPWSVTSHLAVISLTSDSAELLYSLPIEALPEGIEFSKNGKQLFVGSTLANHISVYTINGMMLERSPFVLPVGEGHAAMGIAFGTN